MSFDSLLENEIKPLGKWQILTFILLVVPGNMPGPLIPQFANLDVDHICGAPWFDGWSLNEIKNFSQRTVDLATYLNMSRWNVSADFQCHRISYESLQMAGFRNGSSYDDAKDSLELNSTSEIVLESCQGQWVYDLDKTYFRRSLIQEYDLVCNRISLIPYSASIQGIGYGIGSVFGGQLGDIHGRKTIISIFYPLTGFFYIVIFWSPTFWLFLIYRFLIGISGGIGYTVGYVLFLELTNHTHRNTLCVIDGILFYVFGSNVNILACYFLQDWRWVHVVCGVVYLSTVSYWCLLPESPRWLIAKGRFEEAIVIVRKAIRINNGKKSRRLDSVTVERLMSGEVEVSDPQRKLDFIESCKLLVSDWKDFLTTVSYVRRWLPLLWVWMVVLGGFYGVSFYAVRLPWNPYIIVVVLSVCNLPLKLPQWYLYHRYDRKMPLVALLLASGVLCLIVFALILRDAAALSIVALAVIAFSVIGCVFDMIYLYTPEVFPTLHRSKALGFIQGFSYLGMLGGMYIERLDQLVWMPLPMLVFGVIFLSSGMCCALVPNYKDGLSGNSDRSKDTEALTHETC